MMPDKVYLEEGCSVPVVGFVSPAWDNPKDKENTVEYIRKDALLEWARLGLEMLDDDTSPVAQAAKAVFNGLIGKLNSM